MANAAAPRVLIVDDTPANLIALRAVLKPLSVDIVEARSGAEALAEVAKEPVAVVLLDVQMPEMDGFETASRLRATENGRQVPILFLTAIYDDARYVRHGYEVGGADYLTKPFDADVLLARVRAFVDLFRQRDEIRHKEVSERTRERDDAVRRVVAFERIATAALKSDDLGSFLRELLGAFMEAAETADSGAVLLREGSVLKVRASIGARAGDELAEVKVGEGVVGKVAETGESLSLTDSWSSIPLRTPQASRSNLRGLFAVPLLHDGEVIGVAHIRSSTKAEFPDAEKRLLLAMAERAAWAVAQHHRRERFYEVLMDAPALISIVRVPGFVCEFTNAAARSLFGERMSVGESARSSGAPLAILDILEQVAATGHGVTLSEYGVVFDWEGNGREEERHFDCTFQPLHDKVGKTEAIISFASDVSTRVHARGQLERAAVERATLLEREKAARVEAELASRAKDDFLATVSHELRTPLNAILGWTVTARRKSPPPEVERALGIIERNARAQARIIDDVLDISRIISGKLRLEIVSADVSEAVAGAVEAVRPAADAKGVTLLVDAPDLGTIAADEDRLQQVVWNVLTNAIKFTARGGQVEVTVERNPSHVLVRVSDTGQGIASSFLPDLFEPFRQADGSTTRRHGGLGLGLAIVKQIVQAHGGSVQAQSPGVGRGSTFVIELPARAPPSVLHGPRVLAVADREPLSSAREIRLDGVRLLVVDDEEDARSLLAEVLTERGADVVTAASAVEALQSFRERRPDILVSDIGMPEMDGYALLEAVRRASSEQGGRTPAIALTAYARPEDARRAQAAGFQMHVSKPVDPSTLVAAIASLAGIPLARANTG